MSVTTEIRFPTSFSMKRGWRKNSVHNLHCLYSSDVLQYRYDTIFYPHFSSACTDCGVARLLFFLGDGSNEI